MIVSGSHCCLLLSSLIEANIGVIIKESKSNITHQRAYQQMQQIQQKKKKKSANKGTSLLLKCQDFYTKRYHLITQLKKTVSLKSNAISWPIASTPLSILDPELN